MPARAPLDVFRAKFTPRASAALPPLGPPNSTDDDGVIPIRDHTPESPSVAMRRKEVELPPRVKNVPVEARPWRRRLVSPAHGEATRALSMARGQRVMVRALLVAVVKEAGAAGTARDGGGRSREGRTEGTEEEVERRERMLRARAE